MRTIQITFLSDLQAATELWESGAKYAYICVNGAITLSSAPGHFTYKINSVDRCIRLVQAARLQRAHFERNMEEWEGEYFA